MKTKFTSVGLLITLMSITQSCQKDESVNLSVPNGTVVKLQNQTEINQLQIAFAKSLAKGIKADPELRKFLKAEALKMFDKDYDILYQMVKDQQIGGGETFRKRLSHYTASENELTLIENKVPSLTIFIPSLPSNFSAETWDANNEIPMVAVRKLDTNDVPFYDDKGIENIIPASDTPGFPILVIKQNERVSIVDNISHTGEYDQPPFYQNNQFAFSFSAIAYDGIHLDNKVSNRVAYSPYFSAKDRAISGPNITAYNLVIDNPNALWQRDYVYYGITSASDRGAVKTNFKETIRSLKLSTAGINFYGRVRANKEILLIYTCSFLFHLKPVKIIPSPP